MEESVFYIAEGVPSDKQNAASFGIVASSKSSKQHAQFRQCYSNKAGFALTGTGFGHRLFTSCKDKALVHVYVWGKESPEQKMPVPEELKALDVCLKDGKPWLLAGGGKSGRIYLWEINSGLLLLAKDAHYQSATNLKFSSDGTFLVSGGADSRILVWKTLDLLSGCIGGADDFSVKPHCVFSDHSLPISDVFLTQGLVDDIKLFSASTDATVRCYNLQSKTLLTTFVAPWPVTSITIDPAQRCFYAGSAEGSIRQIRLYQANAEGILAAVGGAGRIVTLTPDHELRETFTHHAGAEVTCLDLSIDGMSLVSGDVTGKAFVSDIVTKQVVRRLKPLNSAITGVKLSVVNYEKLDKDSRLNADVKQLKALPALKRSLVEERDVTEKHDIWVKIEGPSSKQQTFDLETFLEKTRQQQQRFVNWGMVNSTVVQSQPELVTVENDSKRVQELEAQLRTVTENYNDLRDMHQSLLEQHKQTLK
ncbi:unnamed protein product [Kuraishia capsulata CBS 1993]|uniref:Pre-rRNA-processing protein IPI3 n=1 Tax=Kuraishia capsulata CBS 1993 TaxID=1382522 RepID=W6MXG1_9ASCO|nr:uncharacterized protein KUCA_T00004815001 [Kuraishia capsulata CBS 1993]CDK28830.1 unnamed protein product [Kuraishia capsulata CBS 1993]